MDKGIKANELDNLDNDYNDENDFENSLLDNQNVSAALPSTPRTFHGPIAQPQGVGLSSQTGPDGAQIVPVQRRQAHTKHQLRSGKVYTVLEIHSLPGHNSHQ